MNLTIAELNELLYCVGKTLDSKYAPLLNRKVAERLYNKLNDELEHKAELCDLAHNGPATDSFGPVIDDMIKGH